MRTIEEVLNCVNYCMFSKGCTKENYDCCYGDKGLSDCDVRLENDYKKIMAEVKKINTFDRLQEICNAERDGRLVLLPCKVGDTVYEPFAGKVYEKTVDRIIINRFTTPQIWIETKLPFATPRLERWDMAIGKTVFLTREEAEKALKERETE